MDELIQLVAKSYGLVGIVLLAPFVAVAYLWRQNIKLQNELIATNQLRVEDSKAIYSKLLEICTEQSSLNKEHNLILDRVVSIVEVNSQLLNGLAAKLDRS